MASVATRSGRVFRLEKDYGKREMIVGEKKVWLALGCALSLAMATSCRLDYEVRTEHGVGPGNQGGAAGGSAVSSGGTPAGLGGADNSGGASSGGAPAGVQLEAVRVVIVDKQLTGLGTQIGTLVYFNEDGPIPPQPVPSAFDFLTVDGENPDLAFDDNAETWFELREEYMPGELRVVSSERFAPPTGAFIDLHQSETRAPTHFRFDAYDGSAWWTMLSERDFVWIEPSDETMWERDQRSFQFPPPSEWQKID